VIDHIKFETTKPPTLPDWSVFTKEDDRLWVCDPDGNAYDILATIAQLATLEAETLELALAADKLGVIYCIPAVNAALAQPTIAKLMEANDDN